MPISDEILDRIRALVVAQLELGVPAPRLNSRGWPILRQNLALFEFLRVGRVSPGKFAAERAVLEPELRRPRSDTRRIWAGQLVKGFDLLSDSAELYRVEFGDPFHPEGIPPNEPGHGLRCTVDPGRGRIFITTGKVELPAAGTFQTEVAAGERGELLTIEQDLRGLALRAAPEGSGFRMIDLPGAWPALLVGEEILEVNGVEQVERRFVEMLLKDVEHRTRVEPEYAASQSCKSEGELYRRLLQSGPIYRAWYNQPPNHGAPCYMIWFAPRIRYALAEHWGWAVLRREGPDSVSRVMPYGARDASTLDRFARIEREAAREADREHRQELLSKSPALKEFLDRLEAEGYECWQCHGRTRRTRWVSLDSAGRGRFRCQDCGARTLLEGPLQYPPEDLRREKQVPLRRACPSCGKEASGFRAIRGAPGEPWLAVCPACGCTSPLDDPMQT